MNWFCADKDDLGRLVVDRHPVWIVWELLANALDLPDVTRVDLHLSRTPDSKLVEITCTDNDPAGWTNLPFVARAFRSQKDGNKRGRFGINLILALSQCRNAIIRSKTGSAIFEHQEDSHLARSMTLDCGSSVWMELEMSQPHFDDIFELFGGFVQQNNSMGQEISVALNGRQVESKSPVGFLQVPGVTAALYESLTPQLCELGIPLCSLDCKWTVDVQGRVPRELLGGVSEIYIDKLKANLERTR